MMAGEITGLLSWLLSVTCVVVLCVLISEVGDDWSAGVFTGRQALFTGGAITALVVLALLTVWWQPAK